MGYSFEAHSRYNSRIPMNPLAPRIGRGHQVDPFVRLDVESGRKSVIRKPLRIGTHAKIRSGSVIYSNTTIGNHFETGHNVIIREENHIGHHVSVWNNTTIDYGCRIGNRVKIHCGGYIAQYSVLEDDVFLAPGVIFANDLFPGNRHAARVLQGPIVRKGAQIGVQCTLLPGVEIGKGALIGAGSVVTRDVPAGAVVYGQPARVQKNRGGLRWPSQFAVLRPEANRFFRRQLAGRPVF